MKSVTEKPKKNKKKLAIKIIVIIVCVIAFIALAAAIFINVVTKPSKDTEAYHPVGGMVISDTVEYKSDSAKSIRHNPVVRMMQMVWRFCEDGDKKKHSTQTPPSNIKETNDIFYIDDGNVFHKFDIYTPEGADISTLPVIIDIHGGGWIYGDKELNKYYCLELANKGYAVFNISYRLVPDVTTVEQIQDCAAALKYISENYSEYNLDSVLLTGDSAGGMLAAYSAALLDSPELRETFGAVDGNIDVDALVLTSPVAFMKTGGAFAVYTSVMWGDYANDEKIGQYMDLDKVLEKATLPPTYLITSEGDALAREQTHKTYDLLKEKGIECDMADFGDDENGEKLDHVFSVLDPFNKAGQEAIDGALAFYQKQIQ